MTQTDETEALGSGGKSVLTFLFPTSQQTLATVFQEEPKHFSALKWPSPRRFENLSNKLPDKPASQPRHLVTNAVTCSVGTSSRLQNSSGQMSGLKPQTREGEKTVKSANVSLSSLKLFKIN
jgi:hypothetical protein